MAEFPEVPGADYVDAWYGSWPDFAGAEIMALYLNRHGRSWLQVQINKPLAAADHGEDAAPATPQVKSGVITFSFTGIVDLVLTGMDKKNQLTSLTLTAEDNFWRLTIESKYGLSGWLKARAAEIDLAPEVVLEADDGSEAES